MKQEQSTTASQAFYPLNTTLRKINLTFLPTCYTIRMNPTDQIDSYLSSLPEWQKDYLDTFRKLVPQALPEVEEAWKWSVPVFIVKGKMLCAMSAFKEHVKFNFFFGAQLQDKHKLFNNGLDSKKQRSIDVKKDEKIEEKKLLDLLTEAGNNA